MGVGRRDVVNATIPSCGRITSETYVTSSGSLRSIRVTMRTRRTSPTSRRWLRVLAVVTVGATVVGAAAAVAFGVGTRGAAHRGTRSGPGRLVRFSGQEISFSHPGSWRVRTRGLIVDASMFSQFVELSPQPMHKACRVRHLSRGGVLVSCHAPFSSLRPNSLLATWSDAGAPGWTLKRAPGTRIKVGGITGKWSVRWVASSDSTIKATEMVSVVAPIPGVGGNYLWLNVELRGPHTAGLVRQVRSMVRSVHWSKRR